MIKFRFIFEALHNLSIHVRLQSLSRTILQIYLSCIVYKSLKDANRFGISANWLALKRKYYQIRAGNDGGNITTNKLLIVECHCA